MHTRGIKVYLYSFFNLGSRCGGGVNVTPCCITPRQRATVTIVEKDGHGPMPKYGQGPVPKYGQGPVPKLTSVEKRKSLSLTGVKVIGHKVKYFTTKIRTDFVSLTSVASAAGPDAKWRLTKIPSQNNLRISHNKMTA
jgi:hypothetical protein